MELTRLPPSVSQTEPYSRYGASAGLAYDDSLSTQHSADSCATHTQKPNTLDDASINAPAAAISSENRTILLPLSYSPGAIASQSIPSFALEQNYHLTIGMSKECDGCQASICGTRI